MAKDELSLRVKAGLARRYPDGRTGALCSNWRGGKPNCQDCGKQLSRKDAKRCAYCEKHNNRFGSNNGNWQNKPPKPVVVRPPKQERKRGPKFDCDFCWATHEDGPIRNTVWGMACEACIVRMNEGDLIIDVQDQTETNDKFGESKHTKPAWFKREEPRPQILTPPS